MESRKGSLVVSKAWMSQEGDRHLKAIIKKKRESTGVRFLSTRFLSERFSGHGLPRTVGDYHNLRKFFWLILTLVFSGFMILQCYKVIKEFNTWPKITNIEVNEVSRPVFPAVTICNQNSLDTNKIKKWYEAEVQKGKNISTNLLSSLLVFDESVVKAEQRYMSCFDALKSIECEMQGKDNCGLRSEERKKRQVNLKSSSDYPVPSTGVEETYNYNYIEEPNYSNDTEKPSNTSYGNDTEENYYNYNYYSYGDNYEDYYGDYYEGYIEPEYDSYDYSDLEDVQSHDVFGLFLKSKADDLSDFKSWIALPDSSIETFGYRLPEIVKSCTFNGNNCDLKKDFYKFKTSKYGSCFTFNSRINKRAPVKYTSKYGSENGLKLTLSSHLDGYLNVLSPEVGFRISVHDPSVVPFPEDIGVDVAPDTKTSLGVTMVEYERLGHPYGNCSSNKWEYAGDYNIFGCRKLCLDKRVMEDCGCTTMIGNLVTNQKKLKEAKLCQVTNPVEMACKIRILKEFSNADGTKCSHCTASCRETQYNVDFSTSRRNMGFQSARTMALSFRDQKKCKSSEAEDVTTDPKLKKDFVDVHVYIKNKNVQKIMEKKAFTWETLISNIGGNVGLFLGLSLIAVMEILEYLLDLILYFLGVNRPEEEEEEEVMIEFTDEFGDLQFDPLDNFHFDEPQKVVVAQSSPAAPVQPVTRHGVVWIPSISQDEILHPRNVVGRLANARYRLPPVDE